MSNMLQMLTELDEWANMSDGSDDDSAASADEGKQLVDVTPRRFYRFTLVNKYCCEGLHC